MARDPYVIPTRSLRDPMFTCRAWQATKWTSWSSWLLTLSKHYHSNRGSRGPPGARLISISIPPRHIVGFICFHPGRPDVLFSLSPLCPSSPRESPPKLRSAHRRGLAAKEPGTRLYGPSSRPGRAGAAHRRKRLPCAAEEARRRAQAHAFLSQKQPQKSNSWSEKHPQLKARFRASLIQGGTKRTFISHSASNARGECLSNPIGNASAGCLRDVHHHHPTSTPPPTHSTSTTTTPTTTSTSGNHSAS